MTKGEAIITTGVGQHQMWTGQFYNFRQPRTFLTSAASARWGLDIPQPSICESGQPEKEVIDIDSDGSFLVNVQEHHGAHRKHRRQGHHPQ